MPIVHIQAPPQDPLVDVRAVMARVCKDLAAAVGCPERQVWATWTTLPEGSYLEADVAAARQPHDTHPPLVRVLAMEGRSPEMIAKMLECVAGSLAATLPMDPDNVFAVYEELHAGRVYFGGRVRP
jgi:phenylpyruvate tautomerase PptA (4-oxalocrotonate tautomerase family)